jgi:hypothetical protein
VRGRFQGLTGEVPEVDFSKYQVRRNRFATRVKQEGVDVLHDGPSAASLAEIPEVDLGNLGPRGRAMPRSTFTPASACPPAAKK